MGTLWGLRYDPFRILHNYMTTSHDFGLPSSHTSITMLFSILAPHNESKKSSLQFDLGRGDRTVAVLSFVNC